MTPKKKGRDGKEGWPGTATRYQHGLRLRFRSKDEERLIRNAARLCDAGENPSLNAYILDAAVKRARADLDRAKGAKEQPRPQVLTTV